MKIHKRVYINVDVLTAVNRRLDFIFDSYKDVVCSLSGGKDSTLLFELAYKKAAEHDRQLHVFFIDQEAEYQSTIDIIAEVMRRPGVVPHWYQVPIKMTNATSYDDEFLYAWGPGEKWMRGKDDISIHQIDAEYPRRFYPFIEWIESQWSPETTCFLVGLRSEESLNRYRAVIKNPGLPGINWSTKNANGLLKFYPIYDWSFDDIFYYFYYNNIKYNRVYDYMHIKDKGEQITKYRVSNLIHEKAYKSLVNLQEFEPDTYERLCARLKGVHAAAIYADDVGMFNTRRLPDKFKSWKEYRDYMLNTIPTKHRERFIKRFKNQTDDELTARQQCRQLMLNDYEGSIPIDAKRAEKAIDTMQKWRELL